MAEVYGDNHDESFEYSCTAMTLRRVWLPHFSSKLDYIKINGFYTYGSKKIINRFWRE
jgi:hypothetical protein